MSGKNLYEGHILRTWCSDPKHKELQAEIAALRQLLAEAKELAHSVVKARKDVCLLGVLAFSLPYQQAQTLLPKLEAVKEKTK